MITGYQQLLWEPIQETELACRDNVLRTLQVMRNASARCLAIAMGVSRDYMVWLLNKMQREGAVGCLGEDCWYIPVSRRSGG